jgi:hypothetical protein
MDTQYWDVKCPLELISYPNPKLGGQVSVKERKT